MAYNRRGTFDIRPFQLLFLFLCAIFLNGFQPSTDCASYFIIHSWTMEEVCSFVFQNGCPFCPVVYRMTAIIPEPPSQTGISSQSYRGQLNKHIQLNCAFLFHRNHHSADNDDHQHSPQGDPAKDSLCQSD